MTLEELNTVDLFCGAGGASTGCDDAFRKLRFKRKGLAINHWRIAVDTMRANHPDLTTLDCKIENAIPAELVHDKVHLLWASPSCFTAGHLVTTARGQVPIEQVEVGDLVLTHRGRWRKVIRKQHRFAPYTVIAKGAGHYGINCTASHRFWMRSSSLEYVGKGRHAVRVCDDPQWMRIDRAIPNEALWCTPVNIEPLPMPRLPDPLATLKNPWWVIGRWLGDGCLGSGRHFDTQICTPHEEEDVIEENLSGGSLKWAKFVKRTVTNYTLSDKETMEWLELHFGRYSHGKSLPSWCLTMPKKLRVELWKGYMSADGYEGNRRHQANTVSKKLAISLRMLGEGIGHRIGLSYEHRPSCSIEGRSGHGRDQYRLHYEGNPDDKREKEAFVDDGMVWSRVREVSCGPQRQTVYNIEVEEDHSYVLDGIVVKNCTHHSRACGGKPRSDQLRSQPDFVLTWMTQCDVDNLIVENVPEFMDWGPLDDEGKPDKSKKGTYFRAWVNHIRDLGYNLKYDVLNCADYGDATTRKRFFLIASKVGLPEPQFPKPRYGKGTGRPWRSARECLDLSDTGKSIFNRKKPLAYNTLRRIAVGMSKYNGMDFMMDMLGSGESDNCRLRQLDLPLQTQHAGGNRFALVRPFIVKLRNNNTVDDIDKPLSTITTSGAHHMLCEPLIVDCIGHAGHAKPPDGPLGTQCTHDRYALATPILIGQQSCAAARSADDPVPTIATVGAIQVATPVILDMSRPGGHDGGHVKSADGPMCTITTCDAMQVALPMLEDGRLIDIRIRMLKPSELAAAHSFPKDYILTGNRGEQVKQIGNSVPVRTASALCEQMLKKYIRTRKQDDSHVKKDRIHARNLVFCFNGKTR